MDSTAMMTRMTTFAKTTHRELLDDSKRPSMVEHLNAHPELVEALIERMKEANRCRPMMEEA